MHPARRSGPLAQLALTLGAVHAVAQPLTWQPPAEVAVGGGERGPWRQNASRYDYVDDPTVALDERGEINVAWVDQSRKDVFFQRFAADGTRLDATPLNVSRTPRTFSWLPRLAVAPGESNRLYVLWQEIIFSGGSHGGDILFSASSDGGRTFTEPLNLSHSIGGDGKGRINASVWHNGSLDLAAGNGGRLYAAWTEYHGPLWFARSTDHGRSFSRPVQVAGNGQAPARAPALTLGPGRTVHLAWTVGEDDSADIRIATSTDGLAFDEPRVLERTSGYSDAPKLVVDSRGWLHVVYAESEGGPFERFHVRHARSRDGGRTFEATRRIAPARAAAGAGAAFPALAIDGRGTLYVAWEHYPDGGGRPQGLGFSASTDGGVTFSPARIIPGSADESGAGNGSYQGLLMEKLAASQAGGLSVVNSSLRPGQRSRVWLMRGEVERKHAGN
jgi:hypothetical protein